MALLPVRLARLDTSQASLEARAVRLVHRVSMLRTQGPHRVSTALLALQTVSRDKFPVSPVAMACMRPLRDFQSVASVLPDGMHPAQQRVCPVRPVHRQTGMLVRASACPVLLELIHLRVGPRHVHPAQQDPMGQRKARPLALRARPGELRTHTAQWCAASAHQATTLRAKGIHSAYLVSLVDISRRLE